MRMKQWVSIKDRKRLLPCIIGYLSGLMVHYTVYSNQLMTPDGTIAGFYRLSGEWELSLGRWGLIVADLLQGGVINSAFSAMLSLLVLSLSGLLLTKLFNTTSLLLGTLLCMTLTCSPMAAMILMYPYCAVPYSVSIFFAIAAAYCAFSPCAHKFAAIGAGVVFLTLSISFYQSNLGTFLIAGAGYVVLYLLNPTHQFMDVLEGIKKFILAAVAGVGIYAGVMKLTLFMADVNMADYKNADQLSPLQSFYQLDSSIKATYRTFYQFFFGDQIVRNAFAEKYIYLGLAVLFLLLIALFTVKVKRSPAMFFITTGILLVFPLLANVIQLAIPGTFVYLLMTGGMMLIVPFLIGLFNLWYYSSSHTTDTIKKGMSGLFVCLIAGLLWSYSLTNQNDALVMLSDQRQSEQLANRIWSQLEQSEYRNGESTLLITGAPHKGNYPTPYPKLMERANEGARFGTVWETYDGNIDTWYNFFQMHLGVSYKRCTPKQFKEIAATKEYQDMPLYPEKQSVKKIDGVYVVKLSEISEDL